MLSSLCLCVSVSVVQALFGDGAGRDCPAGDPRSQGRRLDPAQLPARAGVRAETISRIETGKHSPGIGMMGKLDRALKRAGV